MNTIVIPSLERISDALFTISENMLKREKPFDNLVVNDSIASPIYTNYLKYENEISQQQKKTLMKYFISSSQHLIKGRLFGRQPIYAKMYPELMNTADQFSKWYFGKQERPARNLVVNTHGLRHLNIKQKIKDEVNEKHPDYFIDQAAKKGKLAQFSKRITDSVSFVVYFNIGIKRMFFCVEVGLDNPSFLIDIGNFFARPQSMFSYENVEDIENGVRVAFDFINSINLKEFVM